MLPVVFFLLGLNSTWSSLSTIVERRCLINLLHLLTLVEDRRLLPTDSSSTNGTAMTVQYARPTVVRNPEDSFKNIYSGFVNGIRIPTDEVQHARLTSTIETNGIHDARNVINEEGWIEVKKKEKKVRFKMQDQFGKTKRSGRIDRSNLK